MRERDVNRQKLGTLPRWRAPGSQAEPPGGPLERYVSVLELVTAFPGSVTMSDVCAVLDMPKTSAHRLLNGLTRAGLLQGGGRHHAYCLGKRMTRLLHAAAQDGWVETLARPAIERLAAERGETCYLTRLVGETVRVVFSISPEVQWRSYVQPGIEMPPHAAATAKAILAFQPPELARGIVGRGFVRLTSQTCTDPGGVLDDYARVRERGYATCVSEIDEGLGALGVPVSLSDGSVLYSVGLTGPVQRVFNGDLPERLTSLREAAARLGRSLSQGGEIADRRTPNPADATIGEA